MNEETQDQNLDALNEDEIGLNYTVLLLSIACIVHIF